MRGGPAAGSARQPGQAGLLLLTALMPAQHQSAPPPPPLMLLALNPPLPLLLLPPPPQLLPVSRGVAGREVARHSPLPTPRAAARPHGPTPRLQSTRGGRARAAAGNMGAPVGAADSPLLPPLLTRRSPSPAHMIIIIISSSSSSS
ncbi:hypothetical protein V8C86DRAFT_2729409, partial [Haematococcus lacustris]